VLTRPHPVLIPSSSRALQAIEEARADQDRRDAERKEETVADAKHVAAYKAAQVTYIILL